MSSEALTPSGNSSGPLALTPEQQDAVTALYESNRLLVALMGQGKTVIGATVIAELLADKQVSRVLIITTPKIANTVWAQEFAKWPQTRHVPVAVATGTPDERMAALSTLR